MLPHERDQLGEQLSAYLDGALNAAETAEVERRLAADPQARAQLATLREAVEALRRLPRRPAPSDLLDGLTARIERAQLLEGTADAGAAVRRPRPVWRLLASAAIVVFAVGGGFWAFSRMSDTLSRNDKQVALQSAPRDGLGEAARSNAASSKLRGVAAQPEAAPRADAAPRPTAPAGPIPAVHGAAAEAREEKSAADRAMLKGTEATADVAARTPSAPEGEALREIDALTPAAPAVAPPPSNLGMVAGGVEIESPTPKLQRELTRADVLHAPFPDEPVQLTVACATEPDRAATRELLVACLAAHGAEPLQADAADKRAPLTPEQAYSVEGQAHRNFGDGPDDQQWLVRLPATAAADLIDELGRATGRDVRLEVRRSLVATGTDQVRALLLGDARDRDDAALSWADGSTATVGGLRAARDLAPAAVPSSSGAGRAGIPGSAARPAEPERAKKDVRRDAPSSAAEVPVPAAPAPSSSTAPCTGPATQPGARFITAVIRLCVVGPPVPPPARATEPSTLPATTQPAAMSPAGE
jgi:hypothetical protein